MNTRAESQPRAFQAYCIGDAKSDTASMTGMLETHFRSAHEPERAQLLDKVVDFDRGRMGPDHLDEYLRERDDRMYLEFDSSWANYFVMDRLSALFPDALFVQLIRGCYTWVESIVNHLATRTIPSDVQNFTDWWFQPERFPHTNNDRALKEAGMYSLECLLARWNVQALRPSNVIPAERLRILRTHELTESFNVIAPFLGIRSELIDGAKSHWNRGSREHHILTLVDESYLEETVTRVCGETMAQFFPEAPNVKDAFELHGRGEN
ncbi:MAG: hypothetical protein QF744_01005 [SAR202 cluster bacterium]|nr:hypothetical protein [SAR202 cluster bacterium]